MIVCSIIVGVSVNRIIKLSQNLDIICYRLKFDISVLILARIMEVDPLDFSFHGPHKMIWRAGSGPQTLSLTLVI